MAPRKSILQKLTRARLLEIAANLEINGLTGSTKDEIVEALAAKHSIPTEKILDNLSRDELKEICESLGLDSSGREKILLINRIIGGEETKNEDADSQKSDTSAATVKEAKDYVHENELVSLRPEIGTQAQFKKKKPPKTYKYDSSLSPAMDYDGQNSTREQGEKLIKDILEADTLEKAKETAQQLKAISKPFLNWAGKAERLSFDVPTLPLFVHERLSTRAIIETLKSHKKKPLVEQASFIDDLFADPRHSITDQVLKAYEWQDKWVNRMILGDSLAVMNSLLHYENLGGQVQMIYMDPPYGVKFGSNFQPFVRKRDVKHNDDDTMTREPEMVKAYRDTWECGLHSYLSYMRDRLLLSRDLLTDTGSIFVQISDENVHHVRELMDEIFGCENFCCAIALKKTGGQSSDLLPSIYDTVLWYTKDISVLKYNALYLTKTAGEGSGSSYARVLEPDSKWRSASFEEIQNGRTNDGRWLFSPTSLTSDRHGEAGNFPYEFQGKTFQPPQNSMWKTTLEGLNRLKGAKRIVAAENSLRFVRYINDFPATTLTSIWDDLGAGSFTEERRYVVQTRTKVLERCLLMTTDPGDLVLDPTCGSGTTSYVAEHWGRRWITIDVSRVPLALARQRLLTATFSYYQLRESNRGPSSGFVYVRKQNKKGEEVGGIVPHVTLESIANNEPPKEEVLVDRPEVDNKIVRVTGPFAFEATIPTPVDWDADGVEDSGTDPSERASFIDRMLEVLRRSPVIMLPGNKSITLKNIRLPAKTLSLSAEAVVPAEEIGKPESIMQLVDWTEEKEGKKLSVSDKAVAVVFGPESGAVSINLVENAAHEANAKHYSHLLVIGFAIEAKAREAIENCDKVFNIPATYVQMTPDLMMGDLLKNMRSSQIFSVCGLPDVKVKKVKGDKYQVELLGLDVFDPVTMEHQPMNGGDVPAWFLDTDYNGLCFHVCQAFFPRTGAWESLKKALKGTYDESVWDHLSGTVSAPFEPGEHKTAAVKVIDDRGNELMVTRTLGTES